jgi:hypothetical protein
VWCVCVRVCCVCAPAQVEKARRRRSAGWGHLRHSQSFVGDRAIAIEPLTEKEVSQNVCSFF